MIFKRIRNLWRLSEHDLNVGQKLQIGDKITTIYKSNQKAQIIKKQNEIDEFLKDNFQ